MPLPGEDASLSVTTEHSPRTAGWREAFTTTRFSPVANGTHRSKGSKANTETRPGVPGAGAPPLPPALICL